jgi:hypothetical protein
MPCLDQPVVQRALQVERGMIRGNGNAHHVACVSLIE